MIMLDAAPIRVSHIQWMCAMFSFSPISTLETPISCTGALPGHCESVQFLLTHWRSSVNVVI